MSDHMYKRTDFSTVSMTFSGELTEEGRKLFFQDYPPIYELSMSTSDGQPFDWSWMRYGDLFKIGDYLCVCIDDAPGDVLLFQFVEENNE